MKAIIKESPEKLLVGKSMRMSLSKNRTHDLWKDFMTNKSLIENQIGTDVYSLQVYDDLLYFEEFNTTTEFAKWAAVEVENLNKIPNGFDFFILMSGLYAVFIHKGAPKEFPKTFQYVLRVWLPQLGYELDNRPHFELLGSKYKNNDPASEEEIWVPIRHKTQL